MTCFFGHTWITVAMDQYTSRGAKLSEIPRQIKFCQCAKCKTRKVLRAGLSERSATYALNVAAKAWQDHNYILMSSSGRIISDDFRPSKMDSVRYNYRPLNSIEEMIEALRKDPKYKKVSNHEMVADAMEQLETVIKMHENL